ncbi:MAG: RNA polymerase sigma-70 factor [Cytophagales bacterium]|nr:RNA polymerase sigma-70 factor [Cytophagales bacterium]
MTNLFINRDAKQVAKLKKGSEKAFGKLFRKYAKKIYNTSRKLKLSHEEAEEVVQELFLKIWQKRTNLDENRSFNAYLLTITKSLIIKKSRQRVYQAAYEKYAITNFSDISHQTEDYVIFSDLEALSRSYVEKLPNQQKQIYMMKMHDNLTMEEIAKTLKVSKRTVENHFYRACKNLRTQLVK